MNIKRLLSLICVVLFLVLSFVISYKITVAVRTLETTTLDVGSEESTSQEASSQNNEETPSYSANDITELPTPITVSMPDDENWCLVLLNAYYKMNSSYEPQLSEVVEGSGIYLDERVAEKFIQMYNAALADNVTLTPASGYVSLDRQTRNFTKQVEGYIALGNTQTLSEAIAMYYVLPTGCSEHNYGLAIDIGWISESFAESPAYEWLKKNAAEYGFIERYTEDKESYTHYQASPWHWRYVGVDAAKAMKADNLCLEEYLGKIN